MSIPPRKLNGGLYTGEPFASAAWANVPMEPEAGELVRRGLRVGRGDGDGPPEAALHQYVAFRRPGNSSPTVGGLVPDEHTMMMFTPPRGCGGAGARASRPGV